VRYVYSRHFQNAMAHSLRCIKARREADVLAKELESCRRQLELVSSAGARSAAEKVRKQNNIGRPTSST